MSNIISKIRQRIALKDKNKFDLSCDHITTTDFMKLTPVYFKEMVPGEQIKIKQSTFTRLSPLTNPMYGRCRIENRAFFVPMRTIFRGWNEFITDTPYEGAYLKCPYLNLHDLAVALKSMSSGTTNAAYDFAVGTGSTALKYNFTVKGKAAYQILCSLGYKFPIGYYYSKTSTTEENDKVSALPLFAFFKIYDDWYKNQAYADSTFYGLFDLVSSSEPTITSTKLADCLKRCVSITYDKDYFTSAWDRPTKPNNGVSSEVVINDVSNDSGNGNYRTRVRVSEPGTAQSLTSSPHLEGKTTSDYSAINAPYQITQYTIDALKSLTDYMKRHQIAGGLAMDRMLSRFGMKPSDAALSRSVYIGKNTVNVQIADVMATAAGEDADSNNSFLGDYAGKGIGFNNGYFEYSTNEYGFLMILSTLVPNAGYVQGLSRYILHKDRLDFFTPEFDSLGVQAISRAELLSDYNGGGEINFITLGEANALDGVFGYTSRYAEYKTERDNLTGDFALGSKNYGLDTWHLNRMINPASATTTGLSHSLDFVSASDAIQYDRIFSLTNDTYDHFINIHHFEIEDYAPMAQLFDDYEFDGGKKEVTMEVNGTQLN